MNTENINMQAKADSPEMLEEYNGSYSKKVHRIGRATMAIALILSFLPVLFLYFVMGYRVPISTYINVIFALTALCIGMWITEPLIWYPILGAAPTYMAYLSGNVKNIRVPVARSVMKKYGEHSDSPRGQVLATFSVAISVFVNLFILAIIVFTGSYFVPLLPQIVLTALSYVVPALIGALIWFRIEESGWLKTMIWAIPSVVIYIAIHVINIEALSDIGEAISIAVTILIGYVTFKTKKDDDPEPMAETK
ncbi:hypothetical protein [Hespellia stercorisuis]|uniref:Uncharacterized protein n=1 Tax=Hespellia stercorisuis DSM 15480 TaxID=1121950 RepID=A0A1M6TW10_9FIRM|nr:hypothetical protein [Hespellia stercorisuis]SHK61126.1 hypothetical protein SAMN02745243_03342 [Hespellia stercorisuis DSM 15480]